MKQLIKGTKYLLVVCVLIFSVGNTFAQEKKKSFAIYHSLGYIGLPNLKSHYGIDYMKIYGKPHFYRNVLSPEIPKTDYIRRWAESSERAKDKVVTLDIEHWPLFGVPEEKIEENLEKYISVAEQFSRYAPHVKFGFYSTLPIRNYRDPVRAIKGYASQVGTWKEKNRKLLSLAQNVDIIMPSLYTFYDNPDDWVDYAKATIEEARQYDKPVYVYLWPEYHQSSRWGWGRYIDEDFFYQQLMTVYEYADGVVLWSPKSATRVKHWRKDDGWWKATEKFLKEIGYNSSKPGSPTIIDISDE